MKNNISETELARLISDDAMSFRNRIMLFRVHWLTILMITVLVTFLAGIYAVRAPDVYSSITMLRVSKPQGNILEAPLIAEFSDQKSTFVENEIEVLKSYSVREKVAHLLIDSLKNNRFPEYYVIFSHDGQIKSARPALRPVYEIVKTLSKVVSIEQKNNLEIINISAESVSAYEAALIANIYAKVYHDMNLGFNRQQTMNVREFLENQSEDKHKKLLEAENAMKDYQEKGGIVALDAQSNALIGQLTDYESRKNAAKIELTVVEKTLGDYKKELARQEPRIKDYLDKYAIEPYLEELQKQIAQYEVKKDIALNNGTDNSRAEVINSYNMKIDQLKESRDKKLEIFKAGMLALSSDEVKQLVQKVLDAEVKYHGLSASYNVINSIVRNYESEFDALPKRTIDLARLEREKRESEKLYLLIQEKYQEALINEQSTPGNVLIIDPARIPMEASRPNRKVILLVGIMSGLLLGSGFVVIRNIFDKTVKTPEDIERLNINLIGWVPRFEYIPGGGENASEFIVHYKPNSVPSEAYRALRTRIQFSRVNWNSIRTILITSSSPQEGKTTSSVNIAGSFAQAGKRTVIIDCDLRKPRVHKVLNQFKAPGLVEYIFEKASYEDIVRKTETEDLFLIPAGTIPTNPSEILASAQFMGLIEKLKEDFEIIVIDSPPILAVTDAEILSRIADLSLLVAAAEITEIDVMKRAAELLQHEQGTFIGILLNNFIYKNGYGSYYKNYYYYQSPVRDKKERLLTFSRH
ncbi:MAG: polysaccharide biosynthesis tyrosine autokinase [Ignavibacteria bacterium]|jgi:tyrosine-protein kinase Etk/Wzc|nr:polysaccharide biosynthesis tyrosine autokinase [Ignavibacteria bacterium]MCU7499415.1 polysaccharide biosynthesis tyrosine autokinase [Ignavibacteria bacterium]MCU7511559.1 polysaccharide biosynthesis tyrosine autokinase [Ignavibacteria bacterium]MCU7521064.1 polysaccharide biosynthesis tyrosine autokinase [Ignavibacteria bacterium]MCU7524315.1 polysaccharide biosynthesis tyrosine autokinase [Ignavibacteria bacterium]